MSALSQKDIDSLLTGAAPAKPATRAPDIIPYNFLRPPRISKDRRATLEAIHARFGLGIQSLLSSRLRTPVDVVVTSVEQATFAEFLLSLMTPCTAYVFNLGDRASGQGVMDVGTQLAFQMVDRLFGGSGEASTAERPLTTLEQAVIGGMVERILGVYRDSWGELLALQPSLEAFESVPETLQIVSREDNVVVGNLEIRIGPMTGYLTLCLPLASLEGFLQEKGRPVLQTRGHSTDRDAERAQIEESLLGAHMPVSVRFPPLRLRGRDAARLAVGQILHTGRSLDTPVHIHLNGRPRFLGQLGRSAGLISVAVTRHLPPGKDSAARAPTGRIVE